MLTQSQDIYGRWKLEVIKEFYFESKRSQTQCHIYDTQVCIPFEDEFLGSSHPPLLQFASTRKLKKNTKQRLRFQNSTIFSLKKKRGRESRGNEVCRFWKRWSSAKDAVGEGVRKKVLQRLGPRDSTPASSTGHSFYSPWVWTAFFLTFLDCLILPITKSQRWFLNVGSHCTVRKYLLYAFCQALLAPWDLYLIRICLYITKIKLSICNLPRICELAECTCYPLLDSNFELLMCPIYSREIRLCGCFILTVFMFLNLLVTSRLKTGEIFKSMHWECPPIHGWSRLINWNHLRRQRTIFTRKGFTPMPFTRLNNLEHFFCYFSALVLVTQINSSTNIYFITHVLSRRIITIFTIP